MKKQHFDSEDVEGQRSGRVVCPVKDKRMKKKRTVINEVL